MLTLFVFQPKKAFHFGLSSTVNLAAPPRNVVRSFGEENGKVWTHRKSRRAIGSIHLGWYAPNHSPHPSLSARNAERKYLVVCPYSHTPLCPLSPHRLGLVMLDLAFPGCQMFGLYFSPLPRFTTFVIAVRMSDAPRRRRIRWVVSHVDGGSGRLDRDFIRVFLGIESRSRVSPKSSCFKPPHLPLFTVAYPSTPLTRPVNRFHKLDIDG